MSPTSIWPEPEVFHIIRDTIQPTDFPYLTSEQVDKTINIILDEVRKSYEFGLKVNLYDIQAEVTYYLVCLNTLTRPFLKGRFFVLKSLYHVTDVAANSKVKRNQIYL